ncbi:hypothetical protein BJ508DRAFT_333012 [Ascobolus immersus RN42]|uniref:Uncharacterized protein n=1 Tax=Ascobolus immersus RN42 TaxID=1160509 RepID=A0A3N4HL13_ASCIM|nr:hypothetical protein BJ508DRAFT_333012 [Ascobolus immersus RN42]
MRPHERAKRPTNHSPPPRPSKRYKTSDAPAVSLPSTPSQPRPSLHSQQPHHQHSLPFSITPHKYSKIVDKRYSPTPHHPLRMHSLQDRPPPPLFAHHRPAPAPALPAPASPPPAPPAPASPTPAPQTPAPQAPAFHAPPPRAPELVRALNDPTIFKATMIAGEFANRVTARKEHRGDGQRMPGLRKLINRRHNLAHGQPTPGEVREAIQKVEVSPGEKGKLMEYVESAEK